MASYSEIFKQNAVYYLKKLRDTGKFELNNIKIKNIRELCVFLDVSTQTLYRWELKYPSLKIEINGGFVDTSDDNIGDVKEIENRDFFSPDRIKKIRTNPKEKKVFNQRYYGWFAGMLGIKGYSDMLVPQLKLRIGNELIRQSGLIDMDKASAKLKQNGDKLNG